MSGLPLRNGRPIPGDTGLGLCCHCGNLRVVIRCHDRHGNGRKPLAGDQVCETCLTRPFRTWDRLMKRRKRFPAMPSAHASPCGCN